jgi:hypothetical protein
MARHLLPFFTTKVLLFLIALIKRDNLRLQQDVAERMGAEVLVLRSSHVSMLSQPKAAADFIANAVASFSD